MLKISKEEFIEELKAELYGYEEIEEALITDFMKRLEIYFKEKKGKNVDYSGDVTIKLKDESELFTIADGFLAAVTNDEIDQYWERWTL